MNKKKKAAIGAFAVLRILLLVLIAAALFQVGKKAYAFGYQVFAEEPASDPPGKKAVVTSEEGISAKELAALLKSKRLIRDERVFWVQYQLSEYKDKLKSGSYILNSSWTSEEILSTLSGEDETETETSGE